MTTRRLITIALGALLVVLLSQATARADTISVDTSSLQGSPPGSFQLAFILLDASISGDGNNTAMLSDFAFGGGSAGSILTSGGGVSGDFTSGLTFTDTNPSGFNFIASGFTPGSVLSFSLSMTANLDSKINPMSGLPGDQFLFFILDSTGNPIPSTDSVTPDAFAIATVTPSGLSVQQFSIPAETTVPEPSSILLLGSGMALGFLRKLRSTKLRLLT